MTFKIFDWEVRKITFTKKTDYSRYTLLSYIDIVFFLDFGGRIITIFILLSFPFSP
jgi:hypothetical protein